jgi:alpha-1,3-rhamnosyl/mannosyltransferase
MKVGFGTTVLNMGLRSGGIDGIGHYTEHLSKCLSGRDDIDLIKFTFGDDVDEALTAVGSFQWQALKALVLGRSFSRFTPIIEKGCDVIHATDHIVPRLKRTPVVATVMDMIPLTNPEWVGYSLKHAKNLLWAESLRWADRIITISDFSKNEIVKNLRVAEDKIDVIPLGVDEKWFCPPSTEDLKRVALDYDLSDKYLLFVGTLQPRKNLARLITAHRSLPREVRMAYPLVVVGRYGWGVPELLAELESRSDPNIKWLSYVHSNDLPTILAGATALVFPSLKEGFGLPILEAFAAGTPVISSRTTAVLEVVGDAATLIDPLEENSIAQGMMDVITKPTVAAKYRERGKLLARQYSWDKTASLTVQSYRRVVS